MAVADGLALPVKNLDVTRSQSYDARMINAATIIIVRRRRTFAVRADVSI
jgi:hypothetical protein